MSISVLSDADCKAAIARIVSEFGDGHVKEGRPIFDAITRLPPGLAEKRLSVRQLLSSLERYVEVLVVFDPDPQNTPYRLHLLHSLGIDDDIAGLKMAPKDLPPLLASTDCDFYVTTRDGRLLAVASHEDEFRGRERLLWCPV